MKKLIIPILLLVLAVIAYFVWANFSDNNTSDTVDEIDLATTTDDVIFEGLEGVEASFAPVKDPGVPVPSLDNIKVTGLVKVTADRLLVITESLKKDHLNPEGWVEIGGIWKAGGNFEGARDAWEYVYALDPFNEVALNNLGNLYVYDLVDLKQAEDWYKKALVAGPKYIPTYYNMAEMYLYKMNDRKKAIEIVKAGIKELPDDGSLQALKERLESGGSM